MKPALACLLGTFFAVVFTTVGVSVAQTPSYSSYSNYFNQQIQQPSTGTYRYSNPRAYTADQYFLHNPAISPYLNLTRPGGKTGLPNYYRYTLPEQNRRGLNAPAGGPGMGPVQAPAKKYTPYYSHYFPSYGK